MESYLTALTEVTEKVRLGGGERAREQHQKRNKLLPRDRINTLVDSGSSFLELSPLAGLDLYEDWTPSGGVITGIGQINGFFFLFFFFCSFS